MGSLPAPAASSPWARSSARCPEDKQTMEAAVMEQPQSSQTVSFETGIDNENHEEKYDDEVVDSKDTDTDENEMTLCEEKIDDNVSNEGEEDDGNEEVSLDDDVHEDERPQETIPANPEDEILRKTSPELDTTAAITNILSEIVNDSDSRAVVGR